MPSCDHGRTNRRTKIWMDGSKCVSVGVGNLFLLAIGIALALLSAKRPQTTVQHAVSYFGTYGKPLFAALMIISMLGWFAIQLNVMTLSVQQWGGSPLVLNVAIGVVLSGIMCFGMRAMKYFSYVCAPLLGITLLYALISAPGTVSTIPDVSLTWLGGVSLIIGANIAAVIDLPTFFQHARSQKSALLCIALLYGLIVPAIEAAGIYLSAVTGGGSILEVLQAGHGMLWIVWVSCFVVLSGWATNNANLYSAIASSHSLPGQWSPKLRAWVLGGLGTVLACFNPLGNLEYMLDMFSVTIGSMGAVVLMSYLLRVETMRSNLCWKAMTSWSAGILVGLFVPLTGVPAFDAFIAAATIQFILKRKQTYATTNT